MTIQQYSELIAQVAKIETMKEQIKVLKCKCDSITAEQAEADHIGADIEKVNEINDRWLSAYDERCKKERKIKKEYKAFRAKIYQSTYGETWRVEERIGNTLFYTNYDSQAEAEAYCQKNNIEYIVE